MPVVTLELLTVGRSARDLPKQRRAKIKFKRWKMQLRRLMRLHLVLWLMRGSEEPRSCTLCCLAWWRTGLWDWCVILRIRMVMRPGGSSWRTCSLLQGSVLWLWCKLSTRWSSRPTSPSLSSCPSSSWWYVNMRGPATQHILMIWKWLQCWQLCLQVWRQTCRWTSPTP